MTRRDIVLVLVIPFIVIAIVATTVTLGGTALLTTIRMATEVGQMEPKSAKLLVIPVGLSFMLLIGIAAALATRRQHGGDH